MTTSVTASIVGREAELARIEAFVSADWDGPRTLLIDGLPGMGKTTLWSLAIDRARERSWQVLEVRPTDAEATFAYAGLGDLLENVPDAAFDTLPSPQRHALRVALLRAEPEGANPDPRAVAVAFLNVLRSLAGAGPLVVAVDDIQWLDAPSIQALAFAVRRVAGDPIWVLLARRSEDRGALPTALDRAVAELPIERMEITPLDVLDVRQLLEARLDHQFPNPALRRIHATSAGNPMYAVELGRALLRTDAPDDPGADVPIPGTLRDLVAGPIRALPAETRRALAVAAVLAAPTVDLVSEATATPADEPLRRAVEAHVVTVETGRIRFVHPLYCVAARDGISGADRRLIHARLAELVTDPEERARHLALATTQPDASVAEALEQAAIRARWRGAPGSSAELAEMARKLTPADRPADSTRRTMVEGWALMMGGDYHRLRELAEGMESGGGSAEERLAGRGFLAIVLCWVFDLRAGVALYRQAIEDLRDDDERRLTWEGGITGALDLLGDDYREALEHGYEELRLAERFGDEPRVVTALRGVARNEQRLTGRMPTELIDRAMDGEPVVREVREVAGWPSFCLADMLSWTDDLDSALARWEWLYREASARAETHSLTDILYRTVLCECAAGSFASALAHADEGCELARDRGATVFEAILLADRALVHAHLGDETAARRDAREAIRLSAGGNPQADRIAAWAIGLLELSIGHPHEAQAQLAPLVESRQAAGVREPGEMRYVPDAVEALIESGRLEEGETMLDWYEQLAEASGRQGALAATARCRGQLLAARGQTDSAVRAMGESLERYARVREPLGHARTLLALGSLERRRLRKRAAREALDDAALRFDALGAAAWSNAARTERARIGGRAPSRDALTPTEAQVASLVAQGRTNREVAAALVVSERTVEGHLSRIYAKLGVRSRVDLARREPEPNEAGA